LHWFSESPRANPFRQLVAPPWTDATWSTNGASPVVRGALARGMNRFRVRSTKPPAPVEIPARSASRPVIPRATSKN